MGPLPPVDTKEHDGPATTDGNGPQLGPAFDIRPQVAEEPPNPEGTLDLRPKPPMDPDDPTITPPAHGGSSGRQSRQGLLWAILAVSVATLIGNGFLFNGMRTIRDNVQQDRGEVGKLTAEARELSKKTENAAGIATTASLEAANSEGQAKEAADRAEAADTSTKQHLAEVRTAVTRVADNVKRAERFANTVEQFAKRIDPDSIRAEIEKLRSEIHTGTDLEQARGEFRAELDKARAAANNEMVRLRLSFSGGMTQIARREALQVLQLSRQDQDAERRRLGNQ